jgi:hypothetical protein
MRASRHATRRFDVWRLTDGCRREPEPSRGRESRAELGGKRKSLGMIYTLRITKVSIHAAPLPFSSCLLRLSLFAVPLWRLVCLPKGRLRRCCSAAHSLKPTAGQRTAMPRNERGQADEQRARVTRRVLSVHSGADCACLCVVRLALNRSEMLSSALPSSTSFPRVHARTPSLAPFSSTSFRSVRRFRLPRRLCSPLRVCLFVPLWSRFWRCILSLLSERNKAAFGTTLSHSLYARRTTLRTLFLRAQAELGYSLLVGSLPLGRLSRTTTNEQPQAARIARMAATANLAQCESLADFFFLPSLLLGACASVFRVESGRGVRPGAGLFRRTHPFVESVQRPNSFVADPSGAHRRAWSRGGTYAQQPTSRLP